MTNNAKHNSVLNTRELYNAICKSIKEEINQPPRIVYKYLTIDGACALIENLSLRYTPPNEFDDIFELCDHGHIKHNIMKKGDFLEDFITELKLSDKDFATLKLMKEQVGVSCYSDSWDINIMWSLYAEKHHGVVIGLKSECVSPLTQVKYIPEAQEVDCFSSLIEQAKYMLFTKSNDWSWQREWRSVELLKNLIFLNDKKLYLKKVCKEAIAEIYIGTMSNEVYTTVDDNHKRFEKLVRQQKLNASIYACMKDLQMRGKLGRTQIE